MCNPFTPCLFKFLTNIDELGSAFRMVTTQLEYSRLMNRKDGPEIFAAWILLSTGCECKCVERGVLKSSNGLTICSAEELAVENQSVLKKSFVKALPYLCSDRLDSISDQTHRAKTLPIASRPMTLPDAIAPDIGTISRAIDPQGKGRE